MITKLGLTCIILLFVGWILCQPQSRWMNLVGSLLFLVSFFGVIAWGIAIIWGAA